MSWSETELLRHIHHVTQISENQDFVPITISLDFVKWNNRWRHEAVSPIFKNIDDLLGQPCLYTYSHEFFKSSYFYLSSHLNPPQYLKLPKASTSKLKPIDPKLSFNESETTWIGQDGGCEGLRQKGWTTVTSGSLLAAESILGIKGIITGQGDNQVIVAFFPVPEEYHTSKTYLTDGKEHLEKVVKNYLIFLKKISNQIGMDIKLEESWVSQKLFNYGKEILSDGIFLTSVLKKISRMFLSVSDNYPSLANRIASIHTAGHSACLKGVDPLLPYFIAVHEICNLILLEQISPITTLGKLRVPIKDKGTKIDDTYLLFLNIFPKDYGGFPVMCFLDYIYRGHPDPITSWLCWYKYSLPYNGLVLSILEWILSLQGIKDTTDYKMIIQDPVSLNWNRPINGVNIIKNSLESTLREVNKNDQINMLLKGCTGKLTDGIIRYLSTIEPFSPRVLNTIFRNSPEGARMDFISTFIDMRTLKNITNRKDMINLRSKLLECDLKWFEFVTTKYIEITHNQIIWRSSYKKQLKTLQLLESNIIDQQFCSTLIAEYLRNKSWRKKIQHVTVPHPYEQTRLEILEHNQSECLKSEYILYIYDPPQQDLTTQGSSAGHTDIRFMKGRFSPYYGSGTAPKISSRLLSFPKTDRSLIAAQALLKTKLWVTKPGSNLHNFLTQLISTRTPLPEDTLKASTGSYSGGSVAHRFDDVVTKHECRPNIRVNFFTQVYISSDTMGKYSKSLENYTIHFQGLFLSGLYAIQFLLDHKKELASQRVVFHQHIACVDCCMKIDDVYFDSCELPPRLNQMKNCRLLYSDIPDISKKLFWLNTKCIKLIGISDRNITIDRRSLAAGWILLGESVNNDNPLVHSPLKPIEEVKLNTHLTIASCLNIGVSKIIYSLTKIWFIENVDYLIRSSNQLNINLYLIARTHLVRSSSMLWSGIRDLMLFPDILNDFLKNTGMFPGSSNAFRGGSSMDILLSNFAHDCLKDILNHKDFQISLFCTTPHVGIIRIVKIWINSICLLHFNDKVDKLVKHLRSLHQIIYQCIIDDTFNLEEFFLRYEKYRARRSLPSLLTQPLILSQEGPEPWVRFVDSTSAMPLFDHLTMRIKSSQDIQLFWQIVSQLSLIKTHRLNLSYQKTVSVPLKTGLTSRPMSVKLSSSDRMPYLEHTIKLTGLYSSSHYKFISLLSYFKLYDKITNVLCLGDGDGGVSRLMAICTTAKSIWYNSLIDLSLFPPHRAANYVPPELLSLLDNKEKTIHGIDLCIQYGGDFTNKEYQKHLVNSIKPNELQLIIMDAESFNAFPICEVMQMTNSVIDIISKTNTRPFVIFKTHLQDAGIMHSIINQFLSITNNLQVITPSLSSYSSQECFICFPVNNKTHLSMDQSSFWCWNDEILDDINLRVSNMTSDMTINYLLSDEVTEEATQLNMYLQGIGYPSALNVCIQVLTADHIDYGSFLLSPVESLAVTSELLNHTILMRLISYGKLISNGKLSMNEYVFRGKTLSESKDLNSLSTILFNLRLMLIGYLYHFIDDQIFQEGITIQYKGTIIYQWIPDLHNWMKKYGRSWYKYWGWVREQFSDVRTHSVP